MIDTVSLRFEPKQFSVTRYDEFTPCAADLFIAPFARMGKGGYLKRTQNPIRKELKAGIYKPRLTLIKRMIKHEAKVFLYVEFSVPKLLFGNNLEELTDEDFERVIDKLYGLIFRMGVVVTKEHLRAGYMDKLHYSKNIVLRDGVLAETVIKEISKTDFDKRYDLDEKQFRNSGTCMRYHTNSCEIVVYDKIADLQKSKISDKRTIDKDGMVQPDLFEQLTRRNHPQIARIEIRFNGIAKIKRIFPVLKIESDFSFASVFRNEISKRVLCHYWSEVTKSYAFITTEIDDPERFIAQFYFNNPTARQFKAYEMYGTIQAAKQIGMRKIRNLHEQCFSKRSWYHFKANLSKYKLPTVLPNSFDQIEEALVAFKPLKTADIRQLDPSVTSL